MSAPLTNRLVQRAARSIVRCHPTSTTFRLPSSRFVAAAPIKSTSRCFATSPRFAAGIMPETDNPQAPDHHSEPAPKVATEIEDGEYHQLADDMMNRLHEKAEQIVETREDVEVDYHDGVLNINFPPNGTYVVNKQPHNKQIWLSSPLSGPKRFDFVMQGEGMHHKEGGGVGDWVYLRDGTSLSDIISKELGVTVEVDAHVEEQMAKKGGVDPFA